jgi:hypothetical protein
VTETQQSFLLITQHPSFIVLGGAGAHSGGVRWVGGNTTMRVVGCRRTMSYPQGQVQKSETSIPHQEHVTCLCTSVTC